MRGVERRVDRDQRLEGPGRSADGVHGARVAVARRQGLGRRRGRRRETLRVAQALALGAQGLLLLDADPGGVDRRHQLLQVGPLALGGVASRPRGREGPVEAPQAAAQRRQALGARDRGRPREGIEHRELARRAHQAPVLVLGGEAHQGPRQRRDGLPGRGLPVDEGAGAPLGRNAPGEDHLALVVGELTQRERGVVVLEAVPEPVRHREGRLDQRVAGPGSHGRRVGGRAGQEAERLCEHGLPRPRLAGDRGQARRRGQLGVLDHDQVADLERPDHGRPNFSR